MASQVIIMPSHLIDSILDHPETPRLIAFGSRDLDPKPSTLSGAGRVLRVEIDRLVHCPELSNRLSDDVFALLLTSSSSPAAMPEPLPEPLVHWLLDQVEPALLDLRRLTGHEQLEIAAAIDAARKAPGTAGERPRRSPATEAEVALLEQAAELQTRVQPALDRIDRKLAAYGTVVRKSGLESAIARLGLQADLGAVLRLDPIDGGFLPGLAPHRNGSFERSWRRALNRLAAFQSGLDTVHRAARHGGTWLDDSVLLPLHATLLDGLTEPVRCGRYRSGGMVIQSPFDGTRHDLAFPAEAVPDAMDAFANEFDSRLWHDIHPLLRCSLAHAELARIHPVSDGNGRLARLLLQLMLIEDRIPALPLEAVICWNRHTYIERVDSAVRKGDFLAFLQWLIKAVEKSIDLGRHFLHEMKPIHTMLLASFSDVDRRFARVAADQAISMVLGPDAQFLQRTLNPQAVLRCLREAGFDAVFCSQFDVIGQRMQLAYSCPLARDFLLRPPARM